MFGEKPSVSLTSYLKKNKKKSAFLIGIILTFSGIIPLIIFTYFADPSSPYVISQETLHSEDGTVLKALLYSPSNEEGDHPGIVVAHGFCGNKQFMQPFCIELVKRGFTVLSIDFRGHGSSDGFLPSNRRALGYGELEWDMMAAVEFLLELENVNRIGLV